MGLHVEEEDLYQIPQREEVAVSCTAADEEAWYDFLNIRLHFPSVHLTGRLQICSSPGFPLRRWAFNASRMDGVYDLYCCFLSFEKF